MTTLEAPSASRFYVTGGTLPADASSPGTTDGLNLTDKGNGTRLARDTLHRFEQVVGCGVGVPLGHARRGVSHQLVNHSLVNRGGRSSYVAVQR